MDIEKKLKDGEDLLKAGNHFYELIINFHEDVQSDEMRNLIETDPRFKEMEKKLNELGDKLGI